jgi:hypothetical protein
MLGLLEYKMLPISSAGMQSNESAEAVRKLLTKALCDDLPQHTDHTSHCQESGTEDHDATKTESASDADRRIPTLLLERKGKREI